jgi:hypothetical protein
MSDTLTPRLHTPKQNLFLAALPEKDYERLQSCLELISLPKGWAVYENGGELDLVYFPTTSIISLLTLTEKGEPIKIAAIGNEGVFGISMLMGRKITPTRAVVQSAGFGYRLKAANLRREFELGSPLRYLLQRYTQILSARIAQTTMPGIHPAHSARPAHPALRSSMALSSSPAPSSASLA